MGGKEGGNEPVVIRRATPGDVERLAELCGQLGYPLSPEQLRSRLAEVSQEEGNDVYVAVGVAGHVVGWMQLYVRQLLMVDRHAEMGGVVVDKAYRGQGVGRMLVEWAETWAQDHDCDTIYLRSNVDRKAAHQFYDRMGYQLAKIQRAYWKPVVGQDSARGQRVLEGDFDSGRWRRKP